MKIFIILATFYLGQCTADGPDRFYKMSSRQIDSLLTSVAQESLTITDRMHLYSSYFLETPYSFICVGDGPYALYEKYPLVNFQETNCMALCEHLLALSISDSWDNFFNNLQQIRYKDGLIGMRTRNHYTIADWLPENKWLLDDVSKLVGGERTKKVMRTISHENFFRGKGIFDMRHVTEDRDITIDYIPTASLLHIQGNLQDGDIGSLLFANKSDIFSAHMFIVLRNPDRLFIRESSNSKMSTFDTEYADWVKIIQGREKYIGIAVMRVRDELNTPERIIFPWHIGDLKLHSD